MSVRELHNEDRELQIELARKLAKTSHKEKIRRVVAGRAYWKELTKTPKEYARFFSDYVTLKELEDVGSFHLTLEVSLPKDPTQGEA